jgi:hypothetical protein
MRLSRGSYRSEYLANPNMKSFATRVITLVYPSSLNDKWKFRMVHYIDESLSKLDIGFAPDGAGAQVVGIRQSFVNRKFVDGFVGCISEIYKTSWETVYVWSLGPTRAGSAPIFLVSEGLTMSISPYWLGDQHLEPTGKYEYAQPGLRETESRKGREIESS